MFGLLPCSLIHFFIQSSLSTCFVPSTVPGVAVPFLMELNLPCLFPNRAGLSSCRELDNYVQAAPGTDVNGMF